MRATFSNGHYEFFSSYFKEESNVFIYLLIFCEAFNIIHFHRPTEFDFK